MPHGQAGWSLPADARDTMGRSPSTRPCWRAATPPTTPPLFHGARDVRVEHLLYALTRVDAAREILEQHGVRTQQLRRDAAARHRRRGAGNRGQQAPRSSTEYENVLRRAAGRAGQDSVPASVHDVMRAVLSYDREMPATALFLRSANDPQQLERWAAEQPARLPAYAAAALQPARGPGADRTARERWRRRCARSPRKLRPIARRCSTSWAKSSTSCALHARTASPRSRRSCSTRSRTWAGRCRVLPERFEAIRTFRAGRRRERLDRAPHRARKQALRAALGHCRCRRLHAHGASR